MVRIFPMLVVLTALANPGFAQFNRTAVSVAGNDANDCSVNAPCRSFSRAIDQTVAHGEVIALDSGGYGPFSVTQPLTVTAAPGARASLTATSGPGVDILVPSPAQVVTISNLSLIGGGSHSGIAVSSGRAVVVRNV
ncbi:MAG TPA: hypothetical protein VFT12_06855, partial [Thermoanaerobaculia bacterium]|nr:hypothetical protein [Thermoanaerobaculia bacterium]